MPDQDPPKKKGTTKTATKVKNPKKDVKERKK